MREKDDKKFAQKKRADRVAANLCGGDVYSRPFPPSPFGHRLKSLLTDFADMRNDSKEFDGSYLEFAAKKLESAGGEAIECLNIDAKIYRNRLEGVADNMLVKDYRKLDEELRHEYDAARSAIDMAVAETFEWVKAKHCALTYSWYGSVVDNKPLWDVLYCALFDRAASDYAEESSGNVAEYLPRHFVDILAKVEEFAADNTDIYEAFGKFFKADKKN